MSPPSTGKKDPSMEVEESSDLLINNNGDGDISDDRRNSRGISSSFFGSYYSYVPREIDVFGFSLEPKYFLLVLLFATLMLGSKGSKCCCLFFLFNLIWFDLFIDILFNAMFILFSARKKHYFFFLFLVFILDFKGHHLLAAPL